MALPIRPRPIPRRDPRHAPDEHDERGQHRELSEHPERVCPVLEASRVRDLARGEIAPLVEAAEAKVRYRRGPESTCGEQPERRAHEPSGSQDQFPVTHASRRHLRHPRELSRSRGCPRGDRPRIARRDLVSRRRRRVRAAPEPLLPEGCLPHLGVPRREPRPRCARGALARDVLARRGRCMPMDARCDRARCSRVSGRAPLGTAAQGCRAVPREPARSGLGLRAHARTPRSNRSL